MNFKLGIRLLAFAARSAWLPVTSRTSTTTPRTDGQDLEPDYYGTGLLFMQMQNYVIPVEKKPIPALREPDRRHRSAATWLPPTTAGSRTTRLSTRRWRGYNSAFNNVLPNIYSAWFKLRALTGGKGEQFAWAQLLRIAAMHRMTDKYGPIPYSGSHRKLDRRGLRSAGSTLQTAFRRSGRRDRRADQLRAEQSRT